MSPCRMRGRSDAAIAQTRESFDVVIARAVATMDWLAEWCLPLAKKGGKFLAMKGKKAADKTAGGGEGDQADGRGEAIVHPVDLPESEHRVVGEIGEDGQDG